MIEVLLLQVQTQPPLPPGLGDLLKDPGQWLTDMFNAALVHLGQAATANVAGFISWLLGSSNVVTETPSSLSYDSAAVIELSKLMVWVGDVALAAIAAIAGINVIIRPHLRAPYHGALEVLPRLFLGAALVNTSLYWCRFLIDLNNAVCRLIVGSTWHGLPGLDHLQQIPADKDAVLLNLIALAIYLLMGLLLTGQMLMRLALVDVLLVIAPIAMLCWILPQTYNWARLWFTTFFGTVFVQAIQVLVLRLGADLLQQLPKVLSTFGADPVSSARVWLMTLLLGLAVLQLARKVPRLMPGYPAGAGMAPTALMLVRQVRETFNSSSNSNNNRRGGK